jgi:hypothetical protein
MSDDLQDLVTKNDMPMMTEKEMRKTHENQHKQAGTMFKNGKRVKPKNKKK